MPFAAGRRSCCQDNSVADVGSDFDAVVAGDTRHFGAVDMKYSAVDTRRFLPSVQRRPL